MKDNLTKSLTFAVLACGINKPKINLDYTEDITHGDLTTNVAMLNANKVGVLPRILAEKIVAELKKDMPVGVKDIVTAGPGFINFFVDGDKIAEEAIYVDGRQTFSKSGKTVMVEYTDPNTFKVFHIGHLMSNSIGESISRLLEYTGDKVVRICYPSDIGLHIAKAIWSIKKHITDMPPAQADIRSRTDFLGRMYVEGTQAYEADQVAKEEIEKLNTILYEGKDPSIDAIYREGRRWSLDHFNVLYDLLGTKFDDTIFESEMAPVGLRSVKANLGKIFEKSDGAIVFKGEKYGSHTRVFVNSKGLPTYEAKEIGLNTTKFVRNPSAGRSVIVTASEQNDYFKCVLKAFELIDPKNGPKTMHIGHGMMRFASGKMSSRTGNVVTAESLIADIKAMVKERMSSRNFEDKKADTIASEVAIAAIKYTILRQAIGGDIVFNSAASISFEGDSGPYLQYSAVRARSVLEKAAKSGMMSKKSTSSFLKLFGIGRHPALALPKKVGNLEHLLIRFPDIVSRARDDFAPQIVANYLVALAGAFNSFYSAQTIVDRGDALSDYYIALTDSFNKTMTDGLWLLGIKIPEEM